MLTIPDSWDSQSVVSPSLKVMCVCYYDGRQWILIVCLFCACVFVGHGFLPGGASPGGDPRPAASLLRQSGHAAAASAQELWHEERWPGQVRLAQSNTDGKSLHSQAAMTYPPYLLSASNQQPMTGWISTNPPSARREFHIWKPSRHERD